MIGPRIFSLASRLKPGCLAALAFGASLSFAVLLEAAPPAQQESLVRGFAQPPESTKPWCYWYWISDNLSKEGITRDLEAMARVGIGEALIGNIFLDDIPAGTVKVLSEEWWGLVEHAIREAGRVGVNIGMFNCPGWSQSGGPWIKPEQAMRYLVSSETRVQGPGRVGVILPVPKEPFQDVAVLAFPAPQDDADWLAGRSPKVICQPAAPGAEKLADGRLDTALVFPSGAGQGQNAFTIEIELAEPLTARSLSLYPTDSAWAARCELQAAGGDGRFSAVRQFKFDRSNMAINVGPMPRGAVTVSFAPATARRFRLVLTGATGEPALAEVNLCASARVESFIEKQLGKMHPTPLPMWDTYLWPAQPEPDTPQLTVPPASVLNLSAKMTADGNLDWDVPAGEWIILRTGLTPTGTRNSPASPEGQGLEVDKMNRAAAKAHFEAFIGQVLKRIPPSERKAFKRVVADSYEMGSQNWTDGFGKTFRKRYGYDPTPWLPVLTGRVVGSADQSDRFLWDLRRLVADQVALDYVGGLRELCRPHGLQLWLENYGHWGFPAEFLQYGGQSDRIGGEFWVTGDLGSIECRAASSCANTYGKPIVSAEAFTGGPPFQTVPWGLKARGDWAFCEGINHFVLHVYIQQPWEDRQPGVNAWFGTEFNRHNTWFDPGRAWIEYLRRCCFLLQQGTRVADVAYFIGEDAPKMTGIRQPPLPPGCDFDYINAEVIQEKLRVKDGVLTLPHGATYRVLVLPELPTMRPELLRRIRQLVKAGATVLGPPPSKSPSLEDYPQCDEAVVRLAAEVWGDTAGAKAGERRFGKGRVIWGRTLSEVFAAENVKPDFQSETPLRYTHRVSGDTHLYFVANPEAQSVTAKAAFRVTGLGPEFWWPDTGRIEHPAIYEDSGGAVRLPVTLGPHGSVFVLFRAKSAAASPIVSVTRNGEPILDTKLIVAEERERVSATDRSVANNFTVAVWANPADDTTLPVETNQGVHGLSEPRNDALFPPHGDGFGGAGHAGFGLAVGRNGVCLFEHGANYFAPVLVHASALTGWTHVAVVYRDTEPSLYLNGVLARQGLKSAFTVHPGIAKPGGGGAPFRGELGPFKQFGHALTETEIAALAKSMPKPGGPLPSQALTVNRSAAGAVEAQVWQAGSYVLQTANGKSRKLDVPAVPAPMEVAGPWEVRFAPGRGAPERIKLDELVSWPQHSDPGVKFFSGQATYRTTFRWNPQSETGNPSSPIILDLGQVRDLATVRLNGQDLGTLWLAPWRVDISGAVRPGQNTLEIEVVNAWNNRLAGDASLPAGQRHTFLARDTVAKNAPLLPAGLLGPVTVQSATLIHLEQP